MNYIITGGTGFIGTHLANLIKEQDENAQVWIWILWILKYISTDDTDGGPQADYVGEHELWRIDRELKEIGPQADGVGEQQLSSIGQQLKENYFFYCRSRKRVGGMWSGMSSNIQEFIRIFFYCRYIAGICRSRKRDGLWSAIAINDQQLKEINVYPQMTQMDTDGCPQADEVREQQLSSIGQQLKEKYVCVPWMICEPNEREGRKLLEEIMKGGNFGQYDTRDVALKRGGMMKHGIWKLKRVMRLVRSYPEEALWESVFRVWHLGWRMLKGY